MASVAKSKVMISVLKFLPEQQLLPLQKVCKRWYNDLFPTYYAPMNAICYKEITVGPEEVMDPNFVENYNPEKMEPSLS